MRVSGAWGTILLAGFMTYVVMGALVFHLLEYDNHITLEDAMFKLKEDFFLNYTTLNHAQVELFIQKLVMYARMGIEPKGRYEEEKHNPWEFTHCFFFVGTVLATIGYGNVCPRTKEGQIFCVVFALFGIPFCLICLGYIGSLVSRLFDTCARTVCRKRNKKSPGYIFAFMIPGIITFLILPSFFFQWTEGWSYYEAVYYTFISLSTIGFGDYLIGRNKDRTYFPGYQLISAIWIIIGLAWIAVMFELLSSLLAPVDPKAASGKKSTRLR